MDSSMQVDLELRLKRDEPVEEPDPSDLALTPEPSGSAMASGSSEPSEPSGSANTSEPAELSALEAAKADRAARNAKYRQDIADNNKILAELAERISKMDRSPSPPARPPLRKKRSHSELLCELILSRMKTGQWQPKDIVDLLLGPTEEDGDGESSSSGSNSKLKGKFGIGDILGQLKGKVEGKEKGKGKGKGKENDKSEDESESESEEEEKGEGSKGKEKDVTEIICPGGDMLLAIEGSNTTFQVYSQTLMCASTFFEELVEDLMCEPGDDEKIPVLVLDGDNIEILRIILRIIHLQNHLVPRGLRPSMLLDTATMVNKYGLQKAVTMAARQWLLNGRDFREYLSDPTMASGCYMVAAALFWDESMFMKCMWELISICTVPLVRLWAWPPLKQELSQKALKLLTMIRDRARAMVYQILLAETGLLCYASWSRTLQDRYESLLARYKPATTVRLPLAQMIFEVKKALFRELGGPSSPMDCL